MNELKREKDDSEWIQNLLLQRKKRPQAHLTPLASLIAIAAILAIGYALGAA